MNDLKIKFLIDDFFYQKVMVSFDSTNEVFEHFDGHSNVPIELFVSDIADSMDYFNSFTIESKKKNNICIFNALKEEILRYLEMKIKMAN